MNDKLNEIEDAITEEDAEDIVLAPKRIVEGESVKEFGDECLDHASEEEPFVILEPSKIGMSAEDYVSMMLKAEEGQRLYLAAMLLSAKLNLLHAKEELEKPLPDMTEEDKAFEERQLEREKMKPTMEPMLGLMKAISNEEQSDISSLRAEYGSYSEEEDQEYDTVSTEFDSDEEEQEYDTLGSDSKPEKENDADNSAGLSSVHFR